MQNEHKVIQVEWAVPVHVKFGRGGSEAIRGPWESLHYLTVKWPTGRGAKYDAACTLCAHAVEGRGSPEVAKEAFIAAAIEADILA